MDGGLDIERDGALEEYLRAGGRVGAGERVEVKVLAGGVSNRTVLVTFESGKGWVVKQALPQLRVAVEWLSDPRRIAREAAGMKVLGEILPGGRVPGLIFLDEANHLLAMEAVSEPYENWKTALLAGRGDLGLVAEFGETLARVHRGGWERRAELGRVFGDRSFFESLRVEPFYLYSARVNADAARFLKELVTETRLRLLTLVHGDYSPKNILVKDGRLVLLDHEVIHWGDPAFDVGFSLAHFLSKGHHLKAHRAAFLEAAKVYWQSYRTGLGEIRWAGDLEEWAVRHTLGCMLARVAGRSPLEYLTAGERQWQEAAVVEMMKEVPGGVDELAETFLIRE